MKKNFIFLIFGMIFLLGSLGFVLGDETVESMLVEKGKSLEVGTFVNPEFSPAEIIVENMNLKKEGDISTFTFNKNQYSGRTGRFKFGENDLTNIMSMEGKESSLKLDSSGKILEADLWISESGSQPITFADGKVVSVKPKDRVIYKDGDLTIIPGSWTSGITEIKSWNGGEIFIEGKNFKLQIPNSKEPIIFSHGNGLHYDGKNLFIKEGESLVSKGVSFISKDKVNFYTDGKAHPGENAISFGEKTFALSCGENPDIGSVTIGADSKYYDLKNIQGIPINSNNMEITKEDKARIDPNKKLTMSLDSKDSYMEFGVENKLDPNIPGVFLSKGGTVLTGTSGVKIVNGEANYYNIPGSVENSLEFTLFDDSNLGYSKAFQFGERSNVICFFKDKGVNWIPLNSGEKYTMLEINKGEPGLIYYRPNGKEMLDEFVRIKSELNEAAELLDKAIREYCKGDSLEAFFESDKLLGNSEINPASLDCFLPIEKMKSVLGDKYESYQSNLRIIPEMTFSTPLLGANENKEGDVLYGVRSHMGIRQLRDFSAIQNKYVNIAAAKYNLTTKFGPSSFAGEGS